MHDIIRRMQFVQKNNKSKLIQTVTKYGIHDQSLILTFIQEKNKPKLLDGTTKAMLFPQEKITAELYLNPTIMSCFQDKSMNFVSCLLKNFDESYHCYCISTWTNQLTLIKTPYQSLSFSFSYDNLTFDPIGYRCSVQLVIVFEAWL